MPIILGNIAILASIASLALMSIVSTLAFAWKGDLLAAASAGQLSMLVFSLTLLSISELSPLLRIPERFALRTLILALSTLGVVMLAQWIGGMLGIREKLDVAEAPIWFSVSILLLVAPVSEEVVVRGLFQQPLASILGPIVAVVLSSLIFSVLHFMSMPWQLMPAIFAVGLLLGYSVLAWGSLVPSMIAHSLLNLQGVLLGRVLGKRGKGIGGISET